MANLGNFDATQVQPNESRDFTPIPSGKYPMQIVASEMKPTNDGEGQYLSLEHEIIDGEHKGRKFWNNLNLENQNSQTVEIAQRDLSAICHAVGQLHVTDSEQLHFKPLLVSVRVRPAGNDKKGVWREAKNEIRGYEPMNGAALQVAQKAAFRPPAPVQTAAPAQVAQAKSAVPPWRKGKTAA